MGPLHIKNNVPRNESLVTAACDIVNDFKDIIDDTVTDTSLNDSHQKYHQLSSIFDQKRRSVTKIKISYAFIS